MTLKYVSSHNIIEPEHHNSLVDACKNILNELEILKGKIDEGYRWVSEGAKMTVEEKISELEALIAKIRRVKYGDYVLADDHNTLVDFALKADETIKAIKNAISPPFEMINVSFLMQYITLDLPSVDSYIPQAKITDPLPSTSVEVKPIKAETTINNPQPSVEIPLIEITINNPQPSISTSVS